MCPKRLDRGARRALGSEQRCVERAAGVTARGPFGWCVRSGEVDGISSTQCSLVLEPMDETVHKAGGSESTVQAGSSWAGMGSQKPSHLRAAVVASLVWQICPLLFFFSL